MRGRSEGQKLVGARCQCGELGGGGDPADFPSGKREDLARRPAFDGARCHPVERSDRDEALPVHQQMFPHFVADDDQIMLARHRCDRLQFGRIEQSPGRVVRIVEDNRAGVGSHRRLKRVSLDPPAGGLKRHFANRPARAANERRISIISRSHNDHLVAGSDRCEDRGGQRLGSARGDADAIGAGDDRVISHIMSRHRRAQCRESTRRGILVRAVLQCARRRVENRLGPAEIREALPQVDGRVLRRGEAHPLEHAGRHRFVQRVHANNSLISFAS